MAKSSILLTLVLLFTALGANAARLHHERWYQDQWCGDKGGVTEYRLPDSARVDCLLPGYAIEFDFASKWAESIGQAVYYGVTTNRRPAIVLIIEYKSECRYIHRLVDSTSGVLVDVGNDDGSWDRIKTWIIGPAKCD